MSAKTFVDTNILVYAHDIDDRLKHDRAGDALRELWNDGTGLLSPQVLQEFYVNVTRKIATPLAKDVARRVVSAYAIWCVDVTSADEVVHGAGYLSRGCASIDNLDVHASTEQSVGLIELVGGEVRDSFAGGAEESGGALRWHD